VRPAAISVNPEKAGAGLLCGAAVAGRNSSLKERTFQGRGAPSIGGLPPFSCAAGRPLPQQKRGCVRPSRVLRQTRRAGAPSPRQWCGGQPAPTLRRLTSENRGALMLGIASPTPYFLQTLKASYTARGVGGVRELRLGEARGAGGDGEAGRGGDRVDLRQRLSRGKSAPGSGAAEPQRPQAPPFSNRPPHGPHRSTSWSAPR
jgi:hypothetical protein